MAQLFKYCLPGLLLLFFVEPAFAHSTEDPPLVSLPRIEGQSIVVDGVLDEGVWAEAATFSEFYQYLPVDGRLAQDSTTLKVWYSPTHIHFGITSYEVHDEVRATLADRDKIQDDDYVYLVLDTYNDQRQAMVIGVNPLGQQADGILRDSEGGRQIASLGSSSTGFVIDLSPDFLFESKGQLTDFGYEVEIKVPFKSFRYQSSFVQSWGFNVIRKIQHSGYVSTWTKVLQGNASFMAQNGSLNDLTDLRRGLVLDISPELTSSANRASEGADWDVNTRDPLGLNVRWGISNNFTFNGTVNPDFSQVEADVAQIQFCLLYTSPSPRDS